MELTSLFPRNRHNDLAEARGSGTDHINTESNKPTDEITASPVKTEKILKIKVYFKIIACKSKRKYISKR